MICTTPISTSAGVAIRWLMVVITTALAGGVKAETSESRPDVVSLSVTSVPLSNDYVLRAWDVDDGLPDNSVRGIAQTPDGYLWLATGGGLARFDGLRFVPFLKGDTSGLESSDVDAVFVARDGALWAGFERGGVARRSGNVFSTIVRVEPPGGPASGVSSFAQDAGGAVWFALNPELKAMRWQNGVLAAFTATEGIKRGRSTYIHSTATGRIWFASTDGCGIFDGKGFQAVESKDGNHPRLTPAGNGGMWAARGQRLLRYGPDGEREDMADLAWLGGAESVSTLYADRSGDLWIGTRGQGLFRFHDRRFLRVPTSHVSVTALFEDDEGNLWVGLRGGGLNRLRPRQFFMRHAEPDLKHVRNLAVTSVFADSAGRVCLVQGRSLVRAVDAANTMFATPAGWSENHQMMTACADPEGGVWLGGLDRALKLWRDGAFQVDEPFPPTTALLMGRQKNLWIAPITGGLYRRNGETITPIPQNGSLTEIRALAEDAEGRLWAGTESGLFRQRQGDEFLPVLLPGAKPGQPIRFIVLDEAGAVWIGAFEGGLYRWQAGKISRLSETAGLPLNDLRSLVIEPAKVNAEGRDGRSKVGAQFWMGTGRGLFRVPQSEVEAVLEGRQSSLHAVSFGRADGLPSLNFAYGFLNATTRTQDGHLWFGTSSGALEILPERFKETVLSRSVLIEEVGIKGAPTSFGMVGSIMIPAKSENLEIRYAFPQLTAPERVRFRYRLTGPGAAGEWIDAGDQRAVTFTYLPPGDWHFTVAASEAGGPWRKNTASLAFTMRAAWWETFWFRLGVGVFGALLLAGVVRAVVKRRMQARMRKMEQEHALERERSRIARDMHDQLGANLTQIGIFAEMAQDGVARDDVATKHLSRVMASAHQAVTALDEIVWAVNPRNDSLPPLLEYIGQYAADFLYAAGVRCQLDLPLNPPPRPVAGDFRHNFFLIVQEALNNVLKHAQAREVRLRIAVDDNALELEIADDGRGLPTTAKAAGADGLINFKERAAALGGTCVIESEPGRGTSLKFHLPWSQLRGR